MSDLRMVAELAEERAKVARLELLLADATTRAKHLEQTTTHYLRAWLDYRDRVFALREALEGAANVLEVEGLIRSSAAARTALVASRREFTQNS